MCRHCDNPETSGLDYLEDVVLPTIREHGWVVQAVGSSRVRAPFAYTVGLTQAGLPELVVTGLNAGRSGALLNAVARYCLTADPHPAHGERICFDGGPCTEMVEVPHPAGAHLFVAVNLYGNDVRAQQVVWADDRGRWRGSGGTAPPAGGSRCSEHVRQQQVASMPSSMEAWGR